LIEGDVLHFFRDDYFVSNAPKKTKVDDMLRAAFARWHVEMWFERAKQETGLGAFEV